MPKFTVKKLLHAPIKIENNTINTTSDTEKSKKKIRRFIGIFLLLLSCIFGINYIVQGIGSVRIGTAGDDSIFTPIVFQKNTETGVTVVEKK